MQVMSAVVVLCALADWSSAEIVRYGNDVAFSEPPEGEGIRPNYLLGSKYTVTHPIVLQKAGIIFGSAITNAKVGVYTDAGGAPNMLVAETGSFEVYFDSVLETPLLTTPTIPAGDYWFMAVYDAEETPVGISFDDSTQVNYIAHTFNAPLPATFPAPTIYTGPEFNYYLVGETTISGDYNGNGTVGPEDYSLWKVHYGSTENLAADGNGDRRVNAADYTVWRNNMGTTLASGNSTSNATVPEPATLSTLLLGVLLVLSPRRALSRKLVRA
jgi:hypothetical protein